jgi:predicted Fe-Mo cluster-binding NifX family protein
MFIPVHYPKEDEMKIALATHGDSLESELDQRFGRSPKFLIYDQDDGSFVIMDNSQNLNAMQGAGIQAAQNVVNSGAGVVITANCGPKAHRVLTEAGVKIYSTTAKTIAEAIKLYLENKLPPADSPNVEGHWD